jgi:predicted RNA-binding Zn-ribbon protein involved in translation (DUF1610 family)
MKKIQITKDMFCDAYEVYNEYSCPNCKYEGLHYGLDYNFNYCPNCGAKIIWALKPTRKQMEKLIELIKRS